MYKECKNVYRLKQNVCELLGADAEDRSNRLDTIIIYESDIC